MRPVRPFAAGASLRLTVTTPADSAGARVFVRPASVGASADLMPKAAPGSVGAMEHGPIVPALGIEGISKSEVSRSCAALDAEVEACRSRPLADTAYPCLRRRGGT